MFTKRIFSQRFGDPNGFLFKGQVWDSHNADSSPGDKNCGICGRHIRFVFILKLTQTSDPTKPPEIGKLEIGRCCFHYFRKWNSPLFDELYYALQYQINRQIAIERDKKVFGRWASVQTRAKMWRSLKREVVVRLKDLRQSNMSAPVGTVAALMEATSRKPISHKRVAAAVRWYDKQIEEIRQNLGQLSE